MTSILLTADPALIALVLASWIWAGLRAGSLPYAATPRELSRRTGPVLALIVVGLVLILARAVLVAALASASWWFAQEKVVLALPLLVAGATATLVASLPRLIALRTAAGAFNGVNAMPPTLRHEASHPLVAWPVQVTAYAAAASGIVFVFVSYPATAGSALAVLTGVALAAAVSWRWLARRHVRLAGEVIVPTRRTRLVRNAGVVGGLGVTAVAVGVLALVVTAPSSAAHTNASGGGTGPTVQRGRDASVGEIRGRAGDEVVHRFTLTARHARLTLSSGSTVDVLVVTPRSSQLHGSCWVCHPETRQVPCSCDDLGCGGLG